MESDAVWSEQSASELRNAVVPQIDEGDPEEYTARLARHESGQIDGWAVRRIVKTGSSVVGRVVALPRKVVGRISGAIDELGKGFGIS